MNAWTNFVSVGSNGFVWLTAWSWQALLLLGAVWLGLKLCRAKSPALRHHVWLTALVAVALLPVVAAVAEKLPLLQTQNRALNFVATIPQPIVMIELSPTTAIETSATTAAPAQPKLPIFLAVMFWLWALGALFALVRLWRQLVSVRSIRINASPVSAAELGCEDSTAPLALSTEINSPVLAGVIRPLIMLPADIADWTTANERRAMIGHELAHVARRDHLTNLLPNLLNVVFYFHPLVRFASRQLQVEREIACDDQVITSGVSAELYAESILKAAERSIARTGLFADSPNGAHQLAFFSNRKTLERRIEMILNTNRIRIVTKQWRYLILPVALIVVASFLLVPGQANKLPTTPERAVAEAARKVAEAVKERGYELASAKSKTTPSPSPLNDEQALIELVQKVIDGIPERKYGDGNLRVSDFFNTDSVRMMALLIEYKGHDFEIKKVVADDFEVILHEGWATVTFNAAIRAQNLVTGDYAKEVPNRYNVRLKNDNGRWWVDRSNEWLELTPKFQPKLQQKPPPPPPPPPAPAKEPALAKPAQEVVVTRKAPPPPPPPPSLVQLPNKEYNFQVIGQESYQGQGKIWLQASGEEFDGGNGTRIRLPSFDARGGKTAFVKRSLYLLDRFEIHRGGQVYYGSGTLKISTIDKQIEYSLSSDGGIYLSPQRTGQRVDFKTLIGQ